MAPRIPSRLRLCVFEVCGGLLRHQAWTDKWLSSLRMVACLRQVWLFQASPGLEKKDSRNPALVT